MLKAIIQYNAAQPILVVKGGDFKTTNFLLEQVGIMLIIIVCPNIKIKIIASIIQWVSIAVELLVVFTK